MYACYIPPLFGFARPGQTGFALPKCHASPGSIHWRMCITYVNVHWIARRAGLSNGGMHRAQAVPHGAVPMFQLLSLDHPASLEALAVCYVALLVHLYLPARELMHTHASGYACGVSNFRRPCAAHAELPFYLVMSSSWLGTPLFMRMLMLIQGRAHGLAWFVLL
jgi:hypothetical protein